MYTFTEAHSPQYTDQTMASIKMRVKFDHLNDVVDFIAHAEDVEEHGRELYNRAAAGEFGLVASPPDVPAVDEQAIRVAYSKITQQFIDEGARSMGYDNILTAVSYASFENQYQADGIKLGQWRSDVWTASIALVDDIIAEGTSAAFITPDEFVKKLPQL